MKHYVIKDMSTGEVLRSGVSSSDDISKLAQPGEIAVEVKGAMQSRKNPEDLPYIMKVKEWRALLQRIKNLEGKA